MLSQETKQLSRSSSIPSASLSSKKLHLKTYPRPNLNDASVRFSQNDPLLSVLATTDSEVKSKFPALKILIA